MARAPDLGNPPSTGQACPHDWRPHTPTRDGTPTVRCARCGVATQPDTARLIDTVRQEDTP